MPLGVAFRRCNSGSCLTTRRRVRSAVWRPQWAVAVADFGENQLVLAQTTAKRYLLRMSSAATGILRGNTITLDSPVPPLEGQRVRVVIALADDDVQLASAEQAKAWSQWIANGPQGPIEDDGEPEFP